MAGCANGHLTTKVWLRHLHYTHNISGEPPPVVVKNKKKVIMIDDLRPFSSQEEAAAVAAAVGLFTLCSL